MLQKRLRELPVTGGQRRRSQFESLCFETVKVWDADQAWAAAAHLQGENWARQDEVCGNSLAAHIFQTFQHRVCMLTDFCAVRHVFCGRSPSPENPSDSATGQNPPAQHTVGASDRPVAALDGVSLLCSVDDENYER